MKVKIQWDAVPVWILGVLKDGVIDGDEKVLIVNVDALNDIEYLKRWKNE